jgi:hypothetical protein
METWIVQRIRTTSLRRVVAWALALGGVTLFGATQLRYARNFLLGPYVLAPADLDAIREVSQAPRYFARVSGSKALETGVQQITVHKRNGVETSRNISAAYYALVVGDKLLVCKSRSGARTTFEGTLAPMSAELTQHLLNVPELRANRAHLYPFYLDDESFRIPGYVAIAVGLVFVVLLLVKGLPAWRHFQDPASHPVVARVNGWGDPVGVAVAAERESRQPRFKGGSGWAVTDQFLVRSSFFAFDLLRLADLLWAYKKVTKHSVNFIPTGKTYEAVLVCYGGAATMQIKEKTVDAILAFAAERAPWALFGFSNELATLFNKKTQEFCAAVEQRKRERIQAAAAAPKGFADR